MGAALAVHGKIGAMFKCHDPAHLGLQLPWPEVHDLAARHGFQGVELTTCVLDAPAGERRQVAAGPGRRRRSRGRVLYAHVNDGPAGVARDELIDTERLLPGASGVIDARAFLTVLDEIGFDGPTLVEPFNAEVRALPPQERVAAVAAFLESVWP